MGSWREKREDGVVKSQRPKSRKWAREVGERAAGGG